MSVLALGVSYRSAPLALLERMAFPSDGYAKAYHRLAELDGVGGGVILSTCNRVEVFAEVDAYHGGFQSVKRFLCEAREVDPDELSEPLYAHYEDQAAEHLFSVASGLDSMVLGEPQVLTQVRQAYKTAEHEGTAGTLLRELFRRAIRAGRRVRAETEIGASPSAFVEAGARLGGAALGGLEGKSLLVVGAGKMSELAVQQLVAAGMGPVRVLARRPERASRLAQWAKGTHGSLGELELALADADFVVSATNATGHVIPADMLAGAAGGRSSVLFVLDLAVPRDVEPEARGLANVELVDIDGLRPAVHGADVAGVEGARMIVSEEVARFSAWRKAARLAPLIQSVYERGERVRQAELEKVKARLADLTEEQRTAVEAMTKGLVAKLLHRPVTRAKEIQDRGDGGDRLLIELFEIHPPPE